MAGAVGNFDDRHRQFTLSLNTQQSDPRIAAIPVVVLSAAENIEAQAPLLTADAYIPKPIEFDSLLQIVEQYCQRSRTHGMQASM